jgi:hypothetical protein
VGHTLLCAHGSVVKLFRDEFKEKMGKGAEIGITLNGDYMYVDEPSKIFNNVANNPKVSL